MGLVTVNGFYKHDFYKVGSAPFPERWKSVGTQSNRGTKYTVCGGVTRVTNFVISGIYPRKGSFSLIKGRNVHLSLQLRTSPKRVYTLHLRQGQQRQNIDQYPYFRYVVERQRFSQIVVSIFFEGPWSGEWLAQKIYPWRERLFAWSSQFASYFVYKNPRRVIRSIRSKFQKEL